MSMAIDPALKDAHDALDRWERATGEVADPRSRAFATIVRDLASQGMGFGAMKQIVVWEWLARDPNGAHTDERIVELAALDARALHVDPTLVDRLRAARTRDGGAAATMLYDGGVATDYGDACAELADAILAQLERP